MFNDKEYEIAEYIGANGHFSSKFDFGPELCGKKADWMDPVSYTHLDVYKRQTFHSSFNQYVNEARLGYACQRIETTDDTLTEISMDSGFGSLRTFNRVFKEKYRLTPSEYRNKLQK